MSRNILKMLVLGALVLAVLASASSASATNWQSNGTPAGVAYSANATTPARLQVGGGPALVCSSSALAGSVFGPSGPPSSGPWNGVESVQPSFSGCTIAGNPATVTASIGSINAISYSSPNTGDNIVSITIAVTVGACTFTITVNVTTTTYRRLAPVSTFTILTLGQNLVGNWSSPACNALLGPSPQPVTWGTPTGSDIVYQVPSSGFQPNVFF